MGSDSVVPPIPAGWVLESGAAIPPIPDGWELETPSMGTPDPVRGRSLSDRVADIWKSPPAGVSLVGMLKQAVEGVTAPGAALSGKYGVQPTTPGMWSEEDEFRQRLARAALEGDAKKLAASTMLASPPGGVFGVSRNTLGTGFGRAGSGAATPPPPGAGTASVKAFAGPQVNPDVVAAAERIGVDLPRFLVDESRLTQGMAAGLKNIPGAGDIIAKATDQTVKNLGRAVDTVKEGFGAGSPAVGGSYAKDALTEWITGGRRIGPSGEEIITGTPAVASRVYDAVDQLINPTVTTPLLNTAREVLRINTARAAAMIPGESAAVKIVSDAARAPNGLTYSALKSLRSYLGEMTPDEIVGHGLRGSEVNRLYAALTADLKTSVQNAGGPAALKRFERANSIYNEISTRRRGLAKILGVKGDAPPEAVFSRLVAMAGSKGPADAGRLMLARKAMGAEAWNEVASAALSRLGRDTRGEFSLDRFLTAYGNMSPAGRNALFNTTGKDGLGKSLDDVYFVTRQIEDRLKEFANPSGTGRSLTATNTVMGVLHNPVKTLATILGGGRMAKVLSEPVSARATADWAQAYRSAILFPHAKASKRVRDAAEQLAGVISRSTGANPDVLAAEMQMSMPTMGSTEGR